MDFWTIKERVETEITQKKSKFIANLFPVESVKEAEEIICKHKKKNYDARHHCIAYRIIENDQIIEKSNDDGEPSGTAGLPMLHILKKNNLANIVIIVTRYFGGILLGTGGLVRAYSESLQKAIEKSEKIQKCLGIQMLVTIEYNYFETFKYYCKNNHILITNVEYNQYIIGRIELEEKKKEKLIEDFKTKKIFLKDLKEITKKYMAKSI